MKNKRLILMLSGIPLLLLIPLVGMAVSKEVKWSLGDFVIMFVLLSSTVFTIEFVLRMVKSTTGRILLCTVILLLLLLIWMELAVGIFGTPLAGS